MSQSLDPISMHVSEFDTLSGIAAFQQVSANLVTSAQPSSDEFALIAAAGFDVVINLALTDATVVLQGEDRRVLELGMDYLNLPLLFDRPTLSQALRVLDLLKTLQDRKVWLHCAKNYRVSSLIYLHRVYQLGIDEAEAKVLQQKIWTPNPVWASLIAELEAHFKSQQFFHLS